MYTSTFFVNNNWPLSNLLFLSHLIQPFSCIITSPCLSFAIVSPYLTLPGWDDWIFSVGSSWKLIKPNPRVPPCHHSCHTICHTFCFKDVLHDWQFRGLLTAFMLGRCTYLVYSITNTLVTYCHISSCILCHTLFRKDRSSLPSCPDLRFH